MLLLFVIEVRKEKELIMETKTEDMRLFHKLVRTNRKKGNDVIVDLNVNGIQYEGDENVITGFGEHFRQLATLDPEMDIFYYFADHWEYSYASIICGLRFQSFSFKDGCKKSDFQCFLYFFLS
jgi:hypothetical protein